MEFIIIFFIIVLFLGIFALVFPKKEGSSDQSDKDSSWETYEEIRKRYPHPLEDPLHLYYKPDAFCKMPPVPEENKWKDPPMHHDPNMPHTDF